MAVVPRIPRVFYEFTTSYYNDTKCQIFDNSTTEKDSCDSNSITYCCNYIAEQKNVILNVCNDYIQYTCIEDEEVRKKITHDFIHGMGIFGILCLAVILLLILCVFCEYMIAKCCSKKREMIVKCCSKNREYYLINS